MYSLVIELYDLIAVLLQVVQMLDLIFITFYRLSIGLLEVDVFHSKQLLFVIQDLVDLGGKNKKTVSQSIKDNKKYCKIKKFKIYTFTNNASPCLIHLVQSS